MATTTRPTNGLQCIPLANNAAWPAPGVYAGVPYTQYATLQAANATMLKALATMPPEKAKYAVENRKLTEAIEDGLTLHTFLLEPARFNKECMLAESCGALLKSGDNKGKPCGAESAELTSEGVWRCKKHREEGPTLKGISHDLMDRLNAAHKEVWRVAGDVMRSAYKGETLIELTLIWLDPATEVLCKCRLDLYHPVEKLIHDVKKTRSVDPEVFGDDVGTYGYHIQDAWYRRGARACFGVGTYDFKFIGVELNKNEANGAQVLYLDAEAQDCGEKAAQSALEVYAQATRTKTWWGYTATPKEVKMRPWVLRREDALAEGQ